MNLPAFDVALLGTIIITAIVSGLVGFFLGVRRDRISSWLNHELSILRDTENHRLSMLRDSESHKLLVQQNDLDRELLNRRDIQNHKSSTQRDRLSVINRELESCETQLELAEANQKGAVANGDAWLSARETVSSLKHRIAGLKQQKEEAENL